MPRLVIVRHGQSTWNRENRFTGWTDVDLTPEGENEARRAGVELRDAGFHFDVVFTSVLRRAIRTAWLILEEMDQVWVPIHKAWRLNERHYGALQGLNKVDQALRFGEDTVHNWRRGYDVRPPLVDPQDPRNPVQCARYQKLRATSLPRGESLKDTVDRFLPCWETQIRPQLSEGKNVLVVAHGNSLRALVKHLEKISDFEITKWNLPTGLPRIYELTSDLEPTKRWFHGDPDEVAERITAVVKQARANGQA